MGHFLCWVSSIKNNQSTTEKQGCSREKWGCFKTVIEVGLYIQIFVHINLPQLNQGDEIFPSGYHLTLAIFEPIANHIEQMFWYPTQWLVWVATLHVLGNLDNIGNRQTVIVVDHCFTSLVEWHQIKHKLKFPSFV